MSDTGAATARLEGSVPMFWVSLLFLLLLASLLRLEQDASPQLTRDVHAVLVALAVLYPLFVAETLLLLVLGYSRWKWHLPYCLVPPLRLGGKDYVTGTHIWLPGLRWVRADETLRLRLEKLFGLPMILVALLTLPLLAAEHWWMEGLRSRPWLLVTLEIGKSLVWLAFAIEFILMVSVVRDKLDYCARHWIDLAIICFPFLAVARLARVGQLARLGQIGRAARVYRVRGVSTRLYRSVIGLQMVRKLVQLKPERQLQRLRERLSDKEREVEFLRAEIEQLERRIAQHRARSQ